MDRVARGPPLSNPNFGLTTPAPIPITAKQTGIDAIRKAFYKCTGGERAQRAQRAWKLLNVGKVTTTWGQWAVAAALRKGKKTAARVSALI
ncbi:hypothetical protein ES288_D11G111500v1 [Gossypium darwinii]|uniref:Uncharacterized protein n=1 Tax=Gossypium darwinii TaxID=34276 RepID=A0A5D2AK24_GOSDA|nr:hypothetical protein ES288_D11G111500v1 [Gossypium darwinii]